MRPLISLVFGVFAMGAGAFAAPDLYLEFTNTPVLGIPGGVVTLTAQTANIAAVPINLNGNSFTLAGTPFVPGNFNTSAFVNQWPLTLAAGQTFGPATIFQLTIPAGTAPGAYSGWFNILGGPGDNDLNLIGSASFEVDVSGTVPEPVTGVAVLSGLGVVLIRRGLGRRGQAARRA